MTITLNNNLSTMKVGEYFWCKYTATSGAVGTFSEFATKTDAEVVGQEIPVASTATPNGYFRFIMVEDWNGKKRLVADRNIQHSISWDNLNTSGIASGSGLPLSSLSEEPTVENGFYRKSYAVRLLTGGINDSDTDNEWNKYIVSSNLGGAITSGDNAVWNWNGISSLTSTTPTGAVAGVSPTSTSRSQMGRISVSNYSFLTQSQLGSVNSGFRPVIEEYTNEFVEFNKTLILHNDEYKKFNESKIETRNNITIIDEIPTMTSNTAPSGVASASSEFSTSYQAWKAFDKLLGNWASNSDDTAWLQYKFNTAKRIKKLELKSASGVDAQKCPTSFTLLASNTGNFSGEQVTLLSQSNISAWDRGETREWELPNSADYLYYRLYMNGKATAFGETIEYVISEFRLLNESVEIIETIIPSSWQTVSSTLPTINQFVDNGMDSLTPLLDRTVQNLNPQEMTLDSTFVGEGKVYRKKVDLNKYFDIKTITTETRKS